MQVTISKEKEEEEDNQAQQEAQNASQIREDSGQEEEMSALKMKRQKKGMTAAQQQGKITGRWTDEEHQRFNEAIRLYGKNWKKVTRYVGTRISAQVRSHAQKVLKDYSPKNAAYPEVASQSEMTDPPYHETIALPRDMNTRTFDHNQAALQGKFDHEAKQLGKSPAGFNGDMADCLASNIAEARKRFRKTSGDTIELGQLDKCEQDMLMQKIHVTKVSCDELSQPARPETDSCIPQDGQSNLALKTANRATQIFDFRSSSQCNNPRGVQQQFISGDKAGRQALADSVGINMAIVGSSSRKDQQTPQVGIVDQNDLAATPAFMGGEDSSRNLQSAAVLSAAGRQFPSQSVPSLRTMLAQNLLQRGNSNAATGGNAIVNSVIASQSQGRQLTSAGAMTVNSNNAVITGGPSPPPSQSCLLQNQTTNQQPLSTFMGKSSPAAPLSFSVGLSAVVTDTAQTPMRPRVPSGGLQGLLAAAKVQSQTSPVAAGQPAQQIIRRPTAIKFPNPEVSQSEKEQEHLSRIRAGFASLQDKRIELVRLIHEAVPDVATHQAVKFRQIKQEHDLFQSVLKDVIKDCKTYFDEVAQSAGHHHQQSQSQQQMCREIRHQMHFFEIDNQSLQIQIDQSVRFVLEQFQGRSGGDDILQVSPENSVLPKGGQQQITETKGGSLQTASNNKIIQDQESQQIAVGGGGGTASGSLNNAAGRNVNNSGSSAFRQKLVQVLSGNQSNTTNQAVGQAGLSGAGNKPTNTILGGLRTHQSSTTTAPASTVLAPVQQNRSLVNFLNDLLNQSATNTGAGARNSNERSNLGPSQRHSFDSQHRRPPSQ